MGSFEENLTRKIYMRVCKYLNQRIRRISEYNEKSFKAVSKKKKKKKKSEETEFDNSIQD